MSEKQPRYIDATFAKAQFSSNFQDFYRPGEVKAMIDEVPTADVTPVVHAHWVSKGQGAKRCSVCSQRREFFNWKFCPTCGAKMDEEQEKCGG